MNTGYRSSNTRNKNGGKKDAKELSRQRKEIVALDPDIGGRDDLEDEDVSFLFACYTFLNLYII